jgi:hypothetical protein
MAPLRPSGHATRLVTVGFACPRCASALEPGDNGVSCRSCEVAFPLFGGLPCLVEDWPLWCGVWSSRLADYLAITEGRLEALRREAAAQDLLERTRRRVERVARALELDRQAVAALFSDLQAGAPAQGPALFPSSDPHADSPLLLQYSEHLFRDWVWGAAENDCSLSLVKRLSSRPLGKVAVFGVGTGRLAFDIQRTFVPNSTLGLDSNPLPLLVAARLMRGEEVLLHEFPLAPNSEDVVALRHRLRLPSPAPDGLAFAFADALRPPVAPGSLDTVVTPWFIDAVEADIRETASAVNRALRPGGVWLNFGPLRFKGPLAGLYLIDEVHDLVESCSFRLTTRLTEDIPYFRSPASGTSRIDRVFGFAAEKTGEAAPLEAPHLFAPWLSNTTLPIPSSAGLPALRKKAVLTVGIVSMIDGRRSIQTLAAELGAQWGVPPAVIEEQLRPFLARLPLDRDAGSGVRCRFGGTRR